MRVLVAASVAWVRAGAAIISLAAADVIGPPGAADTGAEWRSAESLR
jgi:hypothetical protein